MIPWWAAVIGQVLMVPVAVSVARWRPLGKRHRAIERTARALYSSAGPLTPWERLPVATRQSYWNEAADLLRGL